MGDVLCLQALSKRIHYGKFVAEAKFRAKPEEYTDLIRRQDAAGIMRLLTDEAVEAKVVERVRRKAATYGQDIVGPSAIPGDQASPRSSCPHCRYLWQTRATCHPLFPRQGYKVRPETVAELYAKWVMPLTKEVQVAYLLRRLD